MSKQSPSPKVQAVIKYMSRHPGMSASKVRCNTARHGVLAADVREAARVCGYTFAEGGRGSGEEPGAPRPASANGRSMTEFKARYDLHYKVGQKIAELLPANGDAYYDDAEFRDLCDIHPQHWRRISDDPRFQANRVVNRQCNVWAPENMVPQMKRILGIA